jgi:hypothetical protein
MLPVGTSAEDADGNDDDLGDPVDGTDGDEDVLRGTDGAAAAAVDDDGCMAADLKAANSELVGSLL